MNYIFEFLKCSLCNEKDMSGIISNVDWRQLYTFASKQALLVFCFDCIERLGKEYFEELKRNQIERKLLME